MAPATCVPVKELKNTSSFTDTVQAAKGPVIVTKNGQEAFVSMSMDCYESLCLDAARARLYQAIDLAEDDFTAGRVVDARGLGVGLKDRYGL